MSLEILRFRSFHPPYPTGRFKAMACTNGTVYQDISNQETLTVTGISIAQLTSAQAIMKLVADLRSDLGGTSSAPSLRSANK